MRFAIIEDGVVVNIAIADEQVDENWVASETAQIGDQYDGETFTEAQTPLEELRSDVLSKLAALRWERETGGIVVASAPIRTDKETRGNIAEARQSFADGFMTSTEWKLGGQLWITLTATQLDAIAEAVTQHVAACFSSERTVGNLIISASNSTEVSAVDYGAEFDLAYAAAIAAAQSA